MVRIIYPADIIWPRGDTGTVQIHVPYHVDEGDIALFLIFDQTKKNILAQQIVQLDQDIVTLRFGQDLAWRLMPGHYYWDVKLYHDPEYDNCGIVMGAKTIDSLYGAFKLPRFEVTEV